MLGERGEGEKRARVLVSQDRDKEDEISVSDI